MQQIGRESGWTRLQQRLQQRYHVRAHSFRPRDEWLTEQLLGQVQHHLVERLQAVGGPTEAQQVEIADWMYVYFAVDCYTYDLLHIEIYPYNTKQSAHLCS